MEEVIWRWYIAETKKSVAAIVIALVLLVASACGGYETYTDVVNGFSISYPEDWDETPEEYSWLGVLDFTKED